MTFGERRKPLARVSPKKAAKQAARREVVAAVRARARNRCEGDRFVPGHRCTYYCDPHEIVQRSAWRDGDLDVDNVVWICRGLHDWAHENVAEAIEVGLLKPSWEAP